MREGRSAHLFVISIAADGSLAVEVAVEDGLSNGTTGGAVCKSRENADGISKCTRKQRSSDKRDPTHDHQQ